MHLMLCKHSYVRSINISLAHSLFKLHHLKHIHKYSKE